MTCGDAVNAYPNTYFVMYDLISNGGVGLPPNPTIIGGNRMFLDNKATIVDVEYNIKFTNKNTGQLTNNGSVQDYYFIDVDPFEITNNKFWTDPYIKYNWDKDFDTIRRDFNL